jgi:hypothetical protein
MPSILFIPDQFTDYRMWSDIPDRIGGRAGVIHFDQHEQIPWTAGAGGGFLNAVRRLAPDGCFDIVVAAGQAARFGFAVAQAGLARGAAFFYPSLDRPLGEAGPSLDDVGAAEALSPYLPVADALLEEDASRQRDILVQVIRDTAGPDVESGELERVASMISDHAAEFFAVMQQARAAGAADFPPPDPPWLEWPWIDRLAALPVPVVAVVAPHDAAIGDAIARQAPDADIVTASPRLTPIAAPDRSAEALLRMLDRLDR